MPSLGLKTSLLWLLSLTVATELIQGAPKCLRTNKKPNSACTSECLPNIGCFHKRKICLCDGDCGFSCINPNQTCLRRSVRNGRVRFSSLRFNGTQTTSCKSGFQLFGSKRRTCRGNGFWDGRRSRCRKLKKICADPGSPGLLMRFRYASNTGFKPGTTLIYYCPPNFSLVGSRTLTCGQDGKWSSSLPVCQTPKCNETVLPPNSYVVRPKNWRRLRDYGVRLTLGCKPGYARLGQRGEQVCVTPGWKLEPSSFTCFPKSCSDPGRPMNGHRKGLFVFREKVYFTCDKCYKLNGPEYRQCQANQRWSDTQPTCDYAVCPSLRSPAHGRVTGKTPNQCDSSVQYSCFYGYQLDGPRRRICQSDGTWSGKEPTCQPKTVRRRPQLKSHAKKSTTKPTSATTKATTTKVPTTVKKTPAPTVRPQSPCGYPNLSPAARIRLIRGRTLIIACQKQYSVVSTGIMRCIQKSWKTYRKVSCLLKGCPFPGVPKNGIKQGLSYLYNDVITLSCDKCYTLSGHSKRKCLTNGTWSHSQAKCVLTTCPPLKNTRKTKVDHVSLNCGATAIYQCMDTHEVMLGSGKRTCGNDGAWSGSEPKCVDRNFNIALGRPTVQSSYDSYWTGPASRAVDGNRHPYYYRRSSCTHTKREYGPWWRVDLGKEESIAMMIVVNRKNCCHDRLDGFEVSVGNNRDGRKNSKCGGRQKTLSGEIIELRCPRVLRGRYVSVYLPKNGWSRILTLCEVEVYRRLIF